jgi:hypothetical protein
MMESMLGAVESHRVTRDYDGETNRGYGPR